jgi:hypothetical protein
VSVKCALQKDPSCCVEKGTAGQDGHWGMGEEALMLEEGREEAFSGPDLCLC